MNILIAEDDALARRILEDAVRSLGHTCLLAEDGQEAWRIFQNSRVDVVISDWSMPKMDGIELCGRVREYLEETSTYAYTIITTALGEKPSLPRAMDAGADDYLRKPLDWVELQVRLKVAERFMGLYRQLEDQKAELTRLNARFFNEARHDPLTQIGNRLMLDEDLEQLRARVERYGHCYCLALCDVDHFKLYNDRYGHVEGDTVLRAVAEVLKVHGRNGDAAYRYGGEEFVVVLPEQDLGKASRAANRLCRAVENLAIPHENWTPPGVVTLSAGVARVCSGEPKSVDQWLAEADTALYAAKRAGRNRVSTYPVQ